MSKKTGKSIRVVISMVLVLAMLGGSCVFADYDTDRIEINDSVIQTIISEDGAKVVTTDFSNGNAIIELYVDEVLVVRGLLNRKESMFYDIRYDSSGKVVDIKTTALPNCNSNSLGVRSHGNSRTEGVIDYDLYDSGYYYAGSTQLNVSGVRGVTGGGQYDLSGTYNNFVHFVGIVAAIINIPAAITSTFAQWFLYFFGFGMAMGTFTIEANYVDCMQSHVYWSAYEPGTGASGNMTSSKYDFDYNGSDYTINDYWYDINALSDHDVSFAVSIYQALAAVYYPSPVSWTVYY